MAVPISVAEAAATLQDHFGPRFEADYEQGRHELANALRQHFHISSREARTLIDELESARTIRWRSGDRANTALGESANALDGCRDRLQWYVIACFTRRHRRAFDSYASGQLLAA